MKTRTIVGLTLVCVLCVFGLAGPQTGQDYFQKALSQERAEGNLREAIVLYQKAIDASRDEALAAKAQLQIGICYEKLGLREAEKAFRLVVDKYPRQSGAVQEARERLQRLARLAAGPEAASGGLSLRKLDMPVGAPSPDGKYLAVHDEGDDLYLYEIANKRKALIKSSSIETGFLMSSVSWSPDSRSIAYIWRAPKHFNELWIWTLGAAEPRLVGSDLQADLGNIAGWSPDQSQIYVQYREMRRSPDIAKALGRISVSSGELEKICDLPKSQFNMRLSPDGRFLAFNVDPSPQDHEIRISHRGRAEAERALEASGQRCLSRLDFRRGLHYLCQRQDRPKRALAVGVWRTDCRRGLPSLSIYSVRASSPHGRPGRALSS